MNTVTVEKTKSPVPTSVKLQTLLDIWSEEMLRDAIGGSSFPSTSTIFLIRELHIGEIVKSYGDDGDHPYRIYGKETRSFRTPTLPEHPIADAVERMLTGPYVIQAPTLRDPSRLEPQDVSLRNSRADFYLIILAEWLGMVPKWQPEAWTAAWRSRQFERSVLAMHTEMQGWGWRRMVRGAKEPLTDYRARLATALGIQVRPFRRAFRSDAYEDFLYSAQIYLGSLPWFQALMFPQSG